MSTNNTLWLADAIHEVLVAHALDDALAAKLRAQMAEVFDARVWLDRAKADTARAQGTVRDASRVMRKVRHIVDALEDHRSESRGPQVDEALSERVLELENAGYAGAVFAREAGSAEQAHEAARVSYQQARSAEELVRTALSVATLQLAATVAEARVTLEALGIRLPRRRRVTPLPVTAPARCPTVRLS